MRRRHEILPSRTLERPIHLWCYGHWGAPLIAFPTAAGFAHEWEAQGMLEAIRPLIDGGRLKLYCPESNISETWNNAAADPAWRAWRNRLYEELIVGELAPWIARDCQSEAIRIATAGCSLGGYYAVNLALKHPQIFHYALGLSGRYEITAFTGGFTNDDVYFSNPMAFVANLEGEHLDRVRGHTHLALVCGQGQWEEGCIEETCRLADLLAAKGISHERDLWGHDVSHTWPWWHRQAQLHLGKTFGG